MNGFTSLPLLIIICIGWLIELTVPDEYGVLAEHSIARPPVLVVVFLVIHFPFDSS